MTILQKQKDGSLLPWRGEPITDGTKTVTILRATAKGWFETDPTHKIANRWGLYQPPRVDVKPTVDTEKEQLDGYIETYSETEITRTYAKRKLSKDEQVGRIKNKAHEDIIAIIPEYKQRNGLAVVCEILGRCAIDGRSPTTKEIAKLEASQAVWDSVNGIRAKSNTDEAKIPD